MITWHPHVHPVVSGLILLVLGLWLAWIYRRNRKVYSKTVSAVLLTPKILIALLLLLALFDPLLNTVRPPESREKFQGVGRCVRFHGCQRPGSDHEGRPRKGTGRTRRQTCWKNGYTWMSAPSTRMSMNPRPSRAKPPRGTDIGTVMATLAEGEGMPGYTGVLLVTDGGDEPVLTARPPGPPVYIIGVGGDSSAWNDLALQNVDAPKVVEVQTPFELSADVRAFRADSDFASRTAIAELTVSEETETGWKTLP